MAEPQWVSLRAYARHREVTLSAVQKAIDARRITAIRTEGQRVTGVDLVEADKQWAANTDAVEALRNGKSVEPPASSALQLAASAGNAPAGSAGGQGEAATGQQGDFLAARVKEAELRGQLLELDKLERIGELLPSALVRREFREIFTQLKTAALRIPDRKAQALAGESDAQRIHRLLSDEIRTVFDEFSRQLGAPAAGVAHDSGMARESEAVLP